MHKKLTNIKTSFKNVKDENILNSIETAVLQLQNQCVRISGFVEKAKIKKAFFANFPQNVQFPLVN